MNAPIPSSELQQREAAPEVKGPPRRGSAALRTHLRPLDEWLNVDGVTEISVNRPGEVWVARQAEAHMTRHFARGLTRDVLLELARQVATHADQEISAERPLLAAELPNGFRVQFVLPPAAGRNVALSIRKPAVLERNLDDYEREGAFDLVNTMTAHARAERAGLRATYAGRKFGAFLRMAVKARMNILISAGTDAGKTTLLNAMLKEVGESERLVIIEDSGELKPTQENVVRLFYSRGGQGLARVTPQDLCEAALRLRPDRILLGELRGAEAFTFLRTINSGHPGSITTIHADSAELAFEQLALMVMQGFPGVDRKFVIDYVRSVIPIVVQGSRSGSRRYISEIYYADADRNSRAA
jgi:type IV secretion system protein VirB11